MFLLITNCGNIEFLVGFARKVIQPSQFNSSLLEMSERSFYDLTPLSDEDAAKAFQDFKKIDKDGNGKLDSDELYNYIKKFKPELRAFSNMIIRVFGDDGTIDWSRFYYSYKSFTASKDSDNYILKLIFKYIDTDGSGTISFEEYFKVFSDFIAPGHNQHMLLGRLAKDDDIDYEKFSKRFVDDMNKYFKICEPED